MLSGDFFSVTSLIKDKEKINAILEINATHKIFEGHFPGQPVVPGVCMMQMIKEILETALGKATRLVSADHLKFLMIIDPTKNNIIHAELKCSFEEGGRIKVGASLLHGSVTYFKMNGIFIPG